MANPRRVRLALATLAALGCALVGWAKLVSSEEPGATAGTPESGESSKVQQGGSAGKIEVLFPPHESVVDSCLVDLIAKSSADSVNVDGKPQELEAFRAPLRVAQLRLSPGFHEIGLGDEKIEFFVTVTPDDHEGPKEWPVVRRHRLEVKGDRCGSCHETSTNSEQVVVGELKSYKACFECHESVEFELIHSHPLEPLEHCQMCHGLHASPNKALLKGTVKKPCDECHES